MAKAGLRAVVFAAVGALALAACGSGSGTSPSSSAGGGATTATSGPQKGGTLYILTNEKQFLHLDPQRNYTGTDLAFANGFLNRTLTAYKFAPGDGGAQLVPDLATDTGTATDGGKTWSFTLRDGVTFQDGSPITCADVKYGISRTFATTVITDGPTYAIQDLAIPTDAKGNSVYLGPYDTSSKNDVAAFDKAVTCSADNKTITMHLNQPVGDWNYAMTLLEFSPVPKAKDTGEKYDDNPVSSGPYQIENYTKGTSLTLVRNPKWSQASDPYRHAYPDKVVVQFGLDPSAIDQRLMADSGPDQTAVTLGGLQPENLATVFNDPKYKDRRFNGYDPYVRYLAINTAKVPNLKQRLAMMAAMDRAAYRTIYGGNFAGDLADGVIKPNLAIDYKPTNLWTGLLGQNIPDNGDPTFAKQLIAQSGAKMPTITYDYPNTPTQSKVASAVVASLGKAGITVKPNPIEPGQYYGVILDPKKADELMYAGWGPDWLNASTVIPPLFQPNGGFDVSQYNNAAFNAQINKAKATLDRTAQGAEWAALNVEAMKDGLVIPTLFGKIQYLVGSKIGGGYIWAPYGCMPFGDLWIKS